MPRDMKHNLTPARSRIRTRKKEQSGFARLYNIVNIILNTGQENGHYNTEHACNIQGLAMPDLGGALIGSWISRWTTRCPRTSQVRHDRMLQA